VLAGRRAATKCGCVCQRAALQATHLLHLPVSVLVAAGLTLSVEKLQGALPWQKMALGLGLLNSPCP